MVLANQLLSLARQFVDVRNSAIEEKQSYLETVCSWFDLECDDNAFPLPAPLSLNPNTSQRFDRTPVVISYLEAYDRRNGFNYADRHAMDELRSSGVRMLPGLDASGPKQFPTHNNA